MNLQTLEGLKRHDKVIFKGRVMYIVHKSPQNPLYACYVAYRKDASASQVKGVKWEELDSLEVA